MKSKANHYLLPTLVLLMLLLGLGRLNAQILVGPKIGGRLSWIAFDQPANELYKARPVFGYSGGLATAFKVRNRFFLQADFVYTRKGKKIEGVSDPALENKAVYHYFNIPIIYRVDFKGAIGKADFKWFLGAGPNINYWWKGKGTLKSSELDENDIDVLHYGVEFDYDPDFPNEDRLYVKDPNRVQLGLLFAVGLAFEPAPHQTFLVDLRFEWGHSFLAADDGRFPNILAYKDDLRARNQGFQLSVSYLFDTMISQRKKGKSTYDKK